MQGDSGWGAQRNPRRFEGGLECGLHYGMPGPRFLSRAVALARVQWSHSSVVAAIGMRIYSPPGRVHNVFRRNPAIPAEAHPQTQPHSPPAGSRSPIRPPRPRQGPLLSRESAEGGGLAMVRPIPRLSFRCRSRARHRPARRRQDPDTHRRALHRYHSSQRLRPPPRQQVMLTGLDE